ncbi:MAG: type II toxin-antitoxin system RelE/ParE family toxin [bacterium]
MAKYKIDFTDEAKIDFSFFSAFECKMMLDQIKCQLSWEPLTETRNRKRLRESSIAPWELRVGKYRVFYEVFEDSLTVSVVAIGYKQHNILYIRNKEMKL